MTQRAEKDLIHVHESHKGLERHVKSLSEMPRVCTRKAGDVNNRKRKCATRNQMSPSHIPIHHCSGACSM